MPIRKGTAAEVISRRNKKAPLEESQRGYTEPSQDDEHVQPTTGGGKVK